MGKGHLGFLAGFLFALASVILIEDAIGKEDFLAAAPYIMVEWYISTPIAVLFLIISFAIMGPAGPKGGAGD